MSKEGRKNETKEEKEARRAAKKARKAEKEKASSSNVEKTAAKASGFSLLADEKRIDSALSSLFAVKVCTDISYQ